MSSYLSFGEIMEERYPDYKWEPLEVTTDDGYILTLNHIWKEGVSDADAKGPILFQHGDQMDSGMWLDWQAVPAPQFAFVELGHHVYMGNTRGTRTSQKHVEYDAVKDAAYWDFTFADMPNDVRANLEKMTEHTGSPHKGYYVGYSQGTVQMLLSLIQFEEWVAERIQNVVLLAPISIPREPGEPDLSIESMSNVNTLRYLGINQFPTNSWAMDRTLICHE